MCLREGLVFICKLTGLSFALERIGPLAATVIYAFYLLIFYLSAISKTPKNLSTSVYSESLIKTACQHLLLLVGFDTLIYRKYCDTPPILVSHHGVQSIRVFTANLFIGMMSMLLMIAWLHNGRWFLIGVVRVVGCVCIHIGNGRILLIG